MWTGWTNSHEPLSARQRVWSWSSVYDLDRHALLLLNPRIRGLSDQPYSPLPHPGVDLTKKAEECDPSIMSLNAKPCYRDMSVTTVAGSFCTFRDTLRYSERILSMCLTTQWLSDNRSHFTLDNERVLLQVYCLCSLSRRCDGGIYSKEIP